MNHRIRLLIAFLGIALASGACSPGGHETHSITISGTLAGTDCFSGVQITPSVTYKVVIDDLLEGASVTLEDQYGGSWEGFMTGDSSFLVTQPLGDPRKQIAVSNMTDSSAFVEAIAECVSFRCCSTTQGTVAVERIL